MKVINTFLPGAFCVTLLLACVAAADTVNLSYTYNPAGRLVSVAYGTNQAISYAYDPAGNLVHASMPSPSLRCSAADHGQVTLTWPAWPEGFVLEVAERLGPGARWQPANGTLTRAGDLYHATLAIGPTAFYRLRKP